MAVSQHINYKNYHGNQQSYSWVFTYKNEKQAFKQKFIQRNTMAEWINKMWYAHTTEYYLAFKRNKVLIHTITDEP